MHGRLADVTYSDNPKENPTNQADAFSSSIPFSPDLQKPSSAEQRLQSEDMAVDSDAPASKSSSSASAPISEAANEKISFGKATIDGAQVRVAYRNYIAKAIGVDNPFFFRNASKIGIPPRHRTKGSSENIPCIAEDVYLICCYIESEKFRPRNITTKLKASALRNYLLKRKSGSPRIEWSDVVNFNQDGTLRPDSFLLSVPVTTLAEIIKNRLLDTPAEAKNLHFRKIIAKAQSPILTIKLADIGKKIGVKLEALHNAIKKVGISIHYKEKTQNLLTDEQTYRLLSFLLKNRYKVLNLIQCLFKLKPDISLDKPVNSLTDIADAYTNKWSDAVVAIAATATTIAAPQHQAAAVHTTPVIQQPAPEPSSSAASSLSLPLPSEKPPVAPEPMPETKVNLMVASSTALMPAEIPSSSGHSASTYGFFSSHIPSSSDAYLKEEQAASSSNAHVDCDSMSLLSRHKRPRDENLEHESDDEQNDFSTYGIGYSILHDDDSDDENASQPFKRLRGP